MFLRLGLHSPTTNKNATGKHPHATHPTDFRLVLVRRCPELESRGRVVTVSNALALFLLSTGFRAQGPQGQA